MNGADRPDHTPPSASPEAIEGCARDARELGAELGRWPRWFVLTGAGCSTESGIPAYRDETGRFMHGKPLEYRDFVGSEAARQRYWARSAIGFERMQKALPNRAHRALARLEELGLQHLLVTQNVDGLHQKAGSRNVLELHGDLASVGCLQCPARIPRSQLQAQLLDENPDLRPSAAARPAPDGDAEPARADYTLRVPACRACAGILKPNVVFFGETVPPDRVSRAYRALDEADAVLVVGSSLMVFSGYRFVRRAASLGKPIVVLNSGKTRADELARLKLTGPCGEKLALGIAELERVRHRAALDQ
jgi:NAD-dependent SIR2 family protein deacetylase